MAHMANDQISTIEMLPQVPCVLHLTALYGSPDGDTLNPRSNKASPRLAEAALKPGNIPPIPLPPPLLLATFSATVRTEPMQVSCTIA